MWQFQDIRMKAIKALESLTLSMDPVDKIVIARKFDVLPWLVPSLHALVQREKPLDLSEGNRLGLEWALKVAEVREYYGAARRDKPIAARVGNPRCASTWHLQTYTSGTAWKCFNCSVSVEPLGGDASIDCCGKIREIFGLE